VRAVADAFRSEPTDRREDAEEYAAGQRRAGADQTARNEIQRYDRQHDRGSGDELCAGGPERRRVAQQLLQPLVSRPNQQREQRLFPLVPNRRHDALAVYRLGDPDETHRVDAGHGRAEDRRSLDAARQYDEQGNGGEVAFEHVLVAANRELPAKMPPDCIGGHSRQGSPEEGIGSMGNSPRHPAPAAQA
jgi:hypothetical protein